MTAQTITPTDLSNELAPTQSGRPHRTLWGDVWVQFSKHKLAIFGLVVLLILLFGVLFGPFIYTEDPFFIDILRGNEPISAEYPFGTDDMGRDTLARNMYGGRISLAVGVFAMLVAMTFGTLVGVLAGYVPALDNPLMRFTDMMLALPQLPLLLVIIMLFRDTITRALGIELGIFLLVVVVIGLFGWMPTARVVRGSVLAIKKKEFVEAAVNVGVSERKIMSRHIFPNVLSPIIVSATLGIANLFDGKDYMTYTPWVIIWPGLFISLTVLSINFMGDGLRDALDPRLRE